MSILEITFRGLEKNESIETLIRKKAAKLEQVCSDLTSCRVAVERPQQHQRAGNPFRVRIDMGVPGHELVVRRESSKGDPHDPLPKVLRDAFNAARRKLREYAKRRQGEMKTHPEQETMAYVYKLFPEEGYGFLKTLDGQGIYFHRNSVLNNAYDRLQVGTGVRFVAEVGEKGLQASTVQIVDKVGTRISKADEPVIEPPLGWRE
jgi:cold shock CspA family protein/ribosome-associated translation inhibitor RaiA